jgi:hypothetical protein
MTDPLNWNGDSEKKLIKYGAIPPESCSNLLDNGLSCIQNDAFNASRINMMAPWLFRQKAINTSNVDSITAVTTGTIKTVPFITTTYRSMQIPSWSSCTRTQPGGLHMQHSRFGHQRNLRMARLRNSSLPLNHGIYTVLGNSAPIFCWQRWVREIRSPGSIQVEYQQYGLWQARGHYLSPSTGTSVYLPQPYL